MKIKLKPGPGEVFRSAMWRGHNPRPHKGDIIPLYSGDGFVRFIDVAGTDKRICEAARISYRAPSKGAELDAKLLRYLLKNRHTSPFEQVNITFNIKMPIFVMRQFVRHRMFRLNEVSARYTELPELAYVPKALKKQAIKNKQGSKGRFSERDNIRLQGWMRQANAAAFRCYKDLLHQGVSKELARTVLPVSTFTEIYVNCDLHNLMHFLRLRQDRHAQEEIRWVADAMADFARRLFPMTFAAFDAYKLKMVPKKGAAEA